MTDITDEEYELRSLTYEELLDEIRALRSRDFHEMTVGLCGPECDCETFESVMAERDAFREELSRVMKQRDNLVYTLDETIGRLGYAALIAKRKYKRKLTRLKKKLDTANAMRDAAMSNMEEARKGIYIQTQSALVPQLREQDLERVTAEANCYREALTILANWPVDSEIGWQPMADIAQTALDKADKVKKT